MAREQMHKQTWNLVRQWSMRLGVLIALAAVLTACGSQPESAPATEPAATTAAPTTAPATTAADEADEAGAATAAAEDEDAAVPAASPVAGAATPVGMTATPEGMVSATPIGAGDMLATPAAGAAEATPVRRNRDNKAAPVGEAAFTADDCAAWLAWQESPDVKAALAYAADWPLIVAEGEKLAAGEPVDTEAMQALATELDGQANVLRDSDNEELSHDPVAFASKAMGLASRMAAGLADGSRTQADADQNVTDLKAAIARYEEDAAARQAACA